MDFFKTKKQLKKQEEEKREHIKSGIMVSKRELNALQKLFSDEDIFVSEMSVGYEKYEIWCYEDQLERVKEICNQYFNPVWVEPEDEDEDESNEVVTENVEQLFEDLNTLLNEKDSDKTVVKPLDETKIMPISKKKTRKKLNRTIEIKARFTPEEVEEIDKKIKLSGLKKGEYIRKSLLEQEIKAAADTSAVYKSIDVMMDLKAEIGRVGGLLKAFIKPNSDNYNVTKEEMESIKKHVNELGNLKTRIDIEVKRIWR